MIIEFIVFYLLFWWVMCILYKDNILMRILEGAGNGTKIRPLKWFLLGVSECEFCMENHTATIGAIAYSCYHWDINYLYWGFLCASISSLSKKYLT